MSRGRPCPCFPQLCRQALMALCGVPDAGQVLGTAFSLSRPLRRGAGCGSGAGSWKGTAPFEAGGPRGSAAHHAREHSASAKLLGFPSAQTQLPAPCPWPPTASLPSSEQPQQLLGCPSPTFHLPALPSPPPLTCTQLKSSNKLWARAGGCGWWAPRQEPLTATFIRGDLGEQIVLSWENK